MQQKRKKTMASKKKEAVTRESFKAIVDSMSEEQFADFVKENKREINQMQLWAVGEEHIARGSFRLAHELVARIVEIEEMEAYASDRPHDAELQSALAVAKMKLEDDFNDLENKVDSFCAVIRLLGRDEDKFKYMAALYATKAKGVANQVESIKKRMCTLMQAVNMEEIEGTYFKVKLGKPTFSLVTNDLTDEEIDALEDRFKKTVVSLDNAAIKAALTDGEKIPWATLTSKVGIRIY